MLPVADLAPLGTARVVRERVAAVAAPPALRVEDRVGAVADVEILVRADSAGPTHDLLDLCREGRWREQRQLGEMDARPCEDDASATRLGRP